MELFQIEIFLARNIHDIHVQYLKANCKAISIIYTAQISMRTCVSVTCKYVRTCIMYLVGYLDLAVFLVSDAPRMLSLSFHVE